MAGSWWRAAALALLLGGLVALGWQGVEGAADEKAGTETLPADLARVPVRSLAMLSVRSADVWAGSFAKGIRHRLGKELMAEINQTEKKLGLSPADIERMTMVMRENPDAQPLLFFGTTKAFDRGKVFALSVPGGKAEKYSGETIVANDSQAGYVLGEKAFVIGSKGDIQSLIDAGKDKQTGGLAPALALAVKKHSAVIAVNPAILSPVEDKLPAQAEPFKPLFKATLATLTIDIGEKTTGNLRIAFPGADEAGAGFKAVEAGQKLALGFLGQGIKELSKDPSAKAIAGLLETAQKSLKSAKIKRDDSAVVGQLEMNIDPAAAGAVVADAARKVREAAVRVQSMNNLKQIGLAMHNYLSANGTFPAQAIYDKDGKALLSWRVTILPYIEANDLYGKFKLDEAWDGPNNKKLLAKMPTIYQAPAGKPKNPHGTFYQAFAGKGAFFEGKKGLGIADFTDGTSNTIMIVEAASDVPWTKPEDIPFDPDKKLPKLGGLYSTPGFLGGLCDGSVRFFSASITPTTLKAAITRNGGEVLGPDF